MMEAQTKQVNHGSLRFYGKHAKINKQIQIQIFEFFIPFAVLSFCHQLVKIGPILRFEEG